MLITVAYLVVSIQWNLKQDWIGVYENQFILVFAFATAFLFISQTNSIGTSGIHPAILFVLSFVVLISLSSFVLCLPISTVNGIKVLDAVFIPTSAATVTGLAVMDTQTEFTMFEK